MIPSPNLNIPELESADSWIPNYPNPADFQFDYYKLLDLAFQNKNGIGKVSDPSNPPHVGIIGAGIAGLTAARELFRCGYKISIFEATDRICGRQYTQHVDRDGTTTEMELGAMRFPFFGKPGSKNCILDYYVTSEAKCSTIPFPNPGSAPGNTGIYVNRGLGPKNEFSKPTLIYWPASTDPNNPPNDTYLKAVYDKVTAFVSLFSKTVGPLYVKSDWLSTWTKIANNYEQLTVSDLVYTPSIETYKNDGWFGGFGMDDDQAQLFALIGSGDGSWGAFYEVSAMWFIRCVMFGFNTNLQSIVGITDKTGLPFYNDKNLKDSNNTKIKDSPQYDGIQTLGEWMFYATPPGLSESVYQSLTYNNPNRTNNGFLNATVNKITKSSSGLAIDYMINGMSNNSIEVDYVIATPTLWASQVAIELVGFDSKTEIPTEVISARNSQHNITSCKVFYPLKTNYWESEKTKIPQILVTDDFVQDAYAVKWGTGTGVLLVSYTWEDDAVKVLPEEDIDLAKLMIDRLEKITQDTVNESIRQYVDESMKPFTIHWSRQPAYRGCAKLYRQRNWALNYSLLSYNQEYSSQSRLYFAGENYGVEGGWSEPALRMAIDSVIHLLKNSGGSFNNDFDVESDYPKYDTSFTPDNTYPSPQFRTESQYL